MIVGIAFCMRCDAPIELDDEYGWTEYDTDVVNMLCETCYEEEIEEMFNEQLNQQKGI